MDALFSKKDIQSEDIRGATEELTRAILDISASAEEEERKKIINQITRLLSLRDKCSQAIDSARMLYNLMLNRVEDLKLKALIYYNLGCSYHYVESYEYAAEYFAKSCTYGDIQSLSLLLTSCMRLENGNDIFRNKLADCADYPEIVEYGYGLYYTTFSQDLEASKEHLNNAAELISKLDNPSEYHNGILNRIKGILDPSYPGK